MSGEDSRTTLNDSGVRASAGAGDVGPTLRARREQVGWASVPYTHLTLAAKRLVSVQVFPVAS